MLNYWLSVAAAATGVTTAQHTRNTIPLPLMGVKFPCSQCACVTYVYTPGGGASAVKKPGHFNVRKSSSQVAQVHFFSQKQLTTFF